MWTVGIETSGREGSVALLRDDEPVAVRNLSHEGRRHARTLVAELKLLLTEATLSPQDCDIVAVSYGPGSFTGLRVGVMCAKTWSFAANCRVVGVDTLLAVAERAPTGVDAIDVIAEAQRGDLYLGRYVRAANHAWRPVQAVAIVAGDAWVQQLSASTVVTGPAAGAWENRLRDRAVVLPPEHWLPHAVEIARIGRRSLLAGRDDNALQLEPLYLRRAAAEDNTDRSGPGRS